MATVTLPNPNGTAFAATIPLDENLAPSLDNLYVTEPFVVGTENAALDFNTFSFESDEGRVPASLRRAVA